MILLIILALLNLVGLIILRYEILVILKELSKTRDITKDIIEYRKIKDGIIDPLKRQYFEEKLRYKKN